MLPLGTRPSSSRAWSQSTGMNGSAQASGRSGCQPSRRLPNTPSSLMPTTLWIWMPSVRCQLGERAVEVGPGEAPLAEQGLGFRTVGGWSR